MMSLIPRSHQPLFVVLFCIVFLLISPVCAADMRSSSQLIQTITIPQTQPDITGLSGGLQITPPTISAYASPAPIPVDNNTGLSSVSTENAGFPDNSSFKRELMHFTSEQLREYDIYRAEMPAESSYSGDPLPAASKSLLSNMPYIGNNRDQGHCGNCWVWASTGAMEIAHSINNKVSDRLSIQYFNSNWNGGSAIGNACSGGWPYQVANFYGSTLKKVVPWSNTNAGYADYHWISGNTSGMPASSISTVPNYPLKSISDTKLVTHTGQTAAINNIKAEINANKPVIWIYYLPSSGWNAFYDFWDSQSESAVWDPDPYNGGSIEAGHAVLIVGYDDTGSTPYWLVLNSWGTSAKRPSGLFRLKMKMDYDGTMTQNGNSYYVHGFDIFNTIYNAPTPTPTPTSTPTITPTPTPTPTPTVTPTPIPGYGNLTVTSTPSQASIWIDAQNTGLRTPATITGISAGVHTLKLVRSGYAEYSQNITIFNGQTTTVAATLSQAGTLSVSSKPTGAAIWIDGTDTGRVTKASITPLTAGTHEVRLVKDGYADYFSSVIIRSGQTTTLYGILTQTGGSIAVSSVPSGANIFIDDRDTGYQSPKTVSGLSAGRHIVLLKKNGYKDWSKTVSVNARMTTQVSATLIPGGINGSLFIYSDPSGASISIDGLSTGYTTAKTVTGIPAGEHTVSLAKSGNNDWSQTVMVRAGVTTTVFGRLSS